MVATVDAISLEEFVRGQLYNLPKFGDSVEVINAKLKQLSSNLQKKGAYLELESYKSLFNSVKELVGDSSTYKVEQTFVDFYGDEHNTIPDNRDAYVTSFKMEIVRN